ncbi:hypothetical protein KSX_06790 [Ktedonospora formicarum]|uniref:Alcohol dehydrogenase-like C-terminal domain-containing protein n=1 Tax=Ktedonospora formicarum TaxID=2778364 RepID=A0A8J3HSM0_9CHLR|nr:hypothetical protein KSX_06790 [Ktedonospora formicarum]
MVNDLTHGRGANLVFEGAGRAQAVADAFAMAKRGGTVLLEGIAGDREKLELATDIFALKQLSVHGLFGASTRAWAHAVSLLRTNQLSLTPLITHRFPLEQYEDALKLLAARQVDTLKVVIQHEGSI